MLHICLYLLIASLGLYNPAPPTAHCLNIDELQLYEMINEYRATKALPSIALSPKLSLVAQVHAIDLAENYKRSDRCNPHSWSKHGDWSSCCYTSDHKEAKCMWSKPREITGYEDSGYEIVYWHSAAAKPNNALNGWKKSKGHNETIINASQWKKATWKAMGVAIYKNYAVVWLGQLEDPEEIIYCE